MKQWEPKKELFVPPKLPLAWQATIYKKGTIFFVKFNPGMVNNTLPSNFMDEFQVPSNDNNDPIYFKLSISVDMDEDTFDIAEIKIVVDKEEPDTIVPTKLAPPSEFEICFGVIAGNIPYMFYENNITIMPMEVFKTEAVPDFTGDEPFERWYQWGIF